MAFVGESPGLGRLAGLRRHALLGRTRPAGEFLFELPQTARPILKLASALSRRDHDAARNMAHAHRGIRGIHALTSGSRCPKSLDIAIARKLVDRHRRCRSEHGACAPRNPWYSRPDLRVQMPEKPGYRNRAQARRSASTPIWHIAQARRSASTPIWHIAREKPAHHPFRAPPSSNVARAHATDPRERPRAPDAPAKRARRDEPRP